MSYVKATNILPEEIILAIQEYIEGQMIYIPKKDETRKSWGENTETKSILKERNQKIFEDYLQGTDVQTLSHQYHLSIKSIYRILAKQKSFHSLAASNISNCC